MYNSWPWIYDAVSFEKKLNSAKINRKQLPVIIIQKFETIGRFSPPNPDYLSSEAKETYFHTNRTAVVMKQFLAKNKYVKDWTNDYFEIHIPSSAD
ncbi:MAG: hypothetical protein AAGH46_10080 [Bacteroidota bacterium]